MTQSDEGHSRVSRSLNDRLAEKLGKAHAVRVDNADEHAALAVAAMVLKKVAEFGQSRISEPTVERVLEKLLAPMTAREVMAVEIEAYECLDWLTGRSDADMPHPETVARRQGETILFDSNSSTLERIQAAIADGFDVRIDYFSRSRGEMNTRRISPIRIDAETYVYAYCHSRHADRVFRLSRITRCIPVNGRPMDPQSGMRESGSSAVPEQISLLDD
jgi:predicted DNA-binding transcriptional regulator YafY